MRLHFCSVGFEIDFEPLRVHSCMLQVSTFISQHSRCMHTGLRHVIVSAVDFSTPLTPHWKSGMLPGTSYAQKRVLSQHASSLHLMSRQFNSSKSRFRDDAGGQLCSVQMFVVRQHS
jgi:hypothetical protein